MRPTQRTLPRATLELMQQLSLRRAIQNLAGRVHMVAEPGTFASTVLQEGQIGMPDSAIQNAMQATMASALCAGRSAQIRILTSASSAGSPVPGMSARMACPMPSGPAPSVRTDEESDASQNATPVTMQKESAMRNAQLASLAPDQSVGKTALQALPHVVLYARPRVNHVAASSRWPP